MTVIAIFVSAWRINKAGSLKSEERRVGIPLIVIMMQFSDELYVSQIINFLMKMFSRSKAND